MDPPKNTALEDANSPRARSVSAISALSRWQKGASQKWQRVQLLWQVLAALWMPTVLWANTAMSRWLPAMAMSHSTLVLGMAHHAFRRLQRLQQPGARLVSTAEAPHAANAAPPGAWLRLLWACVLALNVTWTHLGALIYHYNPKAVKVEFGDATSLHGLPCAGREMLLLCMPPPGEAACAEEALNNFRGRYVAYVGEWGSGMTATSAFHESLLSKFELEARLPLPCFPLMRLECFIFQRKKRKSAAEVIGSDGLRSCDACGAVASEEVTLYLCPVTRWWRFGSEACYDKSLPQQRALMDIQSCGIRQELPEWATWEADEWVEYGSSSKQWAALKRATPQPELQSWRRPKASIRMAGMEIGLQTPNK